MTETDRHLTMTPCDVPGCCEPLAASVDLRPVEGDGAEAELAELAKAIAHPTRVRILRLLADAGPSQCGDVVGALPLAQSTVSQHLKILLDAGLVRGDVAGPRRCYCVDPRGLRRLRALVGAL